MNDPNVIQLLQDINEAMIAMNNNLCWGVAFICLAIFFFTD